MYEYLKTFSISIKAVRFVSKSYQKKERLHPAYQSEKGFKAIGQTVNF